MSAGEEKLVTTKTSHVCFHWLKETEKMNRKYNNYFLWPGLSLTDVELWGVCKRAVELWQVCATSSSRTGKWKERIERARGSGGTQYAGI